MKKFALFVLIFAAAVGVGLGTLSYLRTNEVDLKYISFETDGELEVVEPLIPIDELVTSMRETERLLGKQFLSPSSVDPKSITSRLQKIAAAQAELQRHESIPEDAAWKAQTISTRSKFLASRFLPSIGQEFEIEANQIIESRPDHPDADQAKILLFCYQLNSNSVTIEETLKGMDSLVADLDSERSRLLLFTMAARQLLFAGADEESAQVLETGLKTVTGKRARARIVNQMLAQGHRPSVSETPQE